jgi:hypothetical protein
MLHLTLKQLYILIPHLLRIPGQRQVLASRIQKTRTRYFFEGCVLLAQVGGGR